QRTMNMPLSQPFIVAGKFGIPAHPPPLKTRRLPRQEKGLPQKSLLPSERNPLKVRGKAGIISLERARCTPRFSGQGGLPDEGVGLPTWINITAAMPAVMAVSVLALRAISSPFSDDALLSPLDLLELASLALFLQPLTKAAVFLMERPVLHRLSLPYFLSIWLAIADLSCRCLTRLEEGLPRWRMANSATCRARESSEEKSRSCRIV